MLPMTGTAVGTSALPPADVLTSWMRTARPGLTRMTSIEMSPAMSRSVPAAGR